MIFRILVALCLATSALAQICCTTKQWEGTEVVLKERNQHDQHGNTQEVDKSVSLVSYDAENNRTSVIKNVTSMSGTERRLQIISDYVTMKRYEIYVDEETCSSQDLHGSFQQQCIQDSDVLLSSGVQGIGANTLTTSTYLQKSFSGHSEITVTEDCFPISQIQFSNFGNKRVQYIRHTDVTAGIADLNIFTPPAYCNEASVLERILFDFAVREKLLN